MPHVLPDFETFKRLAESGQGNVIPLYRRLMSDQLSPVLVYRRLVRPDRRMAPSFLLESVVGGERVGHYSYMGARPMTQVVASGPNVRHVSDDADDRTYRCDDPLREMGRLIEEWKLAPVDGLPDFTGGWVGYAAYDAVRYLEGEKLQSPPTDDRRLPDLHMQLYRQIVAFDHVHKAVLPITHVLLDEHDSLEAAYETGSAELDELVRCIETPAVERPGDMELTPGEVILDTAPPDLPLGNMAAGEYQQAVSAAKEYISAGDIFQVVLSQRFELETTADPFDVYRALRVVNPSPYMFYLQAESCILVGSSPEILCRVQDGVVTNRPLAGTRRRSEDEAKDKALEEELLADPKERAEHIMLVDLGRNDVGRVAEPGSIELPQIMVVERYSHVMHISSTVTGRLRPGCTCWDALQMTLPVGTVSGSPKVRAMQIIDEMEPTRRGPYAGAVGYVDLAGNMDMAIALRTMVVTPGSRPGVWQVHIQAGAGIVADSQPETEHQETVSKATALAKAVDLAERAFAE